MSTNIPKAREIIEAVIKNLRKEGRIESCVDAAALEYALSMMMRERTKKTTARSSRKTPEQAAELKRNIAEFCKANPDMGVSEVAGYFGVNPGRVSEAIKEFG